MKKALFFILIIAGWEAVSRTGIWADYLFPSPFSVFLTLLNGFKDGTFTIAIIASLKRIFKGYLLSLAVGVPMGLLIGRVKFFSETVGSLVMGLQTLPSICWLPLSILWFGLNEKAIIFIVVIGAIFSLSLSTEAGVRNISPLYLRAAQTMGARGWRIYLEVIIPGALPSIITGMKLAWSFAWRSLMAGELLSSGVGLGQVLMVGRDLADMKQVVAVMLIIAILGLAIDRLIFRLLEGQVQQKWGLARL